MSKELEELIDRMPLEQKIGQLFTVGFTGGVITPEIIRAVRDLHCGGIRIHPNFVARSVRYRRVEEDGCDPLPPLGVYLTPREHLEELNELQKMAVGRPGGVPLHVAIDWEGGVSADVSRGGYPLFPAAMGLACDRDVALTYEVNKAIGALCRASGVTNIHSPVLDIHSNPDNPEINIRAFGDTPAGVARYAAAAMRGLTDGGLVATAKHFPGRGGDAEDAHYELPVMSAGRAEIFRTVLLPYRRLIPLGLPSIMLAHQIVPAFGDGQMPATLSRAVIQGVIREALGFNGVITTDSITMNALLKICPAAEASARALQAGCDLVLFKSEVPEEVEAAMKQAAEFVRTGRIPIRQIDESLRRVLAMKERLGLFRTRGWNDPMRLEGLLASGKYQRLATRAARTATLMVRDTGRLLPVARKARVLVVEQALFQTRACNDKHCHPYMLWEQVRRLAPGADLYRLGLFGNDEDLRQLAARVGRYDVVIASSYYSRGAKSNGAFLARLQKLCKRMPVVSMTPYPLSAPEELDCVLCVFSEYAPSLQAAAEIIFGRRKAEGRRPVGNARAGSRRKN